MKNKIQSVSLVLAALCVGPVSAQVNEGWEVELSPYAWLSGMSGTLTVLGQDVDFDKSAEDMMDVVEVAASLDTIVRYNRFVVDFTVDYFDLSTDELDVNDQPQGGKLEIEMMLMELSAGYQFALGKHGACDAMLGVRNLNIETDLTVYLTGNTLRRENDVTDPILLIRPSLAIWPSKLKGLKATCIAGIGGGGDSKLIYEIFPELRWEIGRHFLLRGGYRLAGWDAEGYGENEINIDISGLVIGLGVKF